MTKLVSKRRAIKRAYGSFRRGLGAGFASLRPSHLDLARAPRPSLGQHNGRGFGRRVAPVNCKTAGTLNDRSPNPFPDIVGGGGIGD